MIKQVKSVEASDVPEPERTLGQTQAAFATGGCSFSVQPDRSGIDQRDTTAVNVGRV